VIGRSSKSAGIAPVRFGRVYGLIAGKKITAYGKPKPVTSKLIRQNC
jgi:hypothetical protein